MSRTCQDLRTKGFEGPLVLVGEESEGPYDKPPLSTDALAGSRPASAIRLLVDEEAECNGTELRLGGAATRLDRADRTVELADGPQRAVDGCVLATGCRARP
ncbi:FAD-dependent oxidoreductase [Streptomyces sp. NBC_01320]|uniref:FAD-dependent oxidoreductase n=1 Tax=Streptomyces sp. NBC_01320 TaxID=2903824 RepID=UPI002E0D4B4F|nr:hypothetical protein OG395_05310 [Streptomyces sp. NBC_01320]